MSADHQSWFDHDRFGMFVHWGLYGLLGRHEWVQSREQIPPDVYERYTEFFVADRYDPRRWAELAAEAGMKYVVLTTKHHEGFALWDSALTDYKSTNTPFGRDAVAEFVEAVRDAGLKVGFYHSVIDWHHPDFTIDQFHPLRGRPDVAELNASRDLSRYTEYLHGQVRELLTGYGEISYLFYDFSYPDGDGVFPGKGREAWRSEELMQLTRELQPGIIVNDRLDLPGDLVTPEQYQPSGPMRRDGELVRWEACQTINGSWGYDRDNLDAKPVDLLVRMLVDGVAKNGNLLLNVGPNGRGEIDPPDAARLKEIGSWMDLHGASIYGAGPSDLTPPPGAVYTQRGDRLYLHLFSWPMRHVHLTGLAGRVRYAQLLNDASEIQVTEPDPHQQAQNTTPGGESEGTVTLTLPVRPPSTAVPVVEIWLEGDGAPVS